MNASLHIVCPHCNAVNRVPAAESARRPKCGRCRELLFAGQPLELSAASFEKHVTRNDIPLIVDFWAPWCGPCKMMAPAFQKAAAELEPSVRLAKLNTEAEQALAAQYRIQSIPTLVVFKKGQEVARQSGAMGAADIVRWARANS